MGTMKKKYTHGTYTKHTLYQFLVNVYTGRGHDNGILIFGVSDFIISIEYEMGLLVNNT